MKLTPLQTVLVSLCLAVGFIAAMVVFTSNVYKKGEAAGEAACQSKQAKANTTAQVKANAKTITDLKRAQTVGQTQEQGRAAIDQFFDHLAKESLHEDADPVDSCVLPVLRLRRWNAANAGRVNPADQRETASEPDASASAAAASAERESAGPGSQPPAGDQGLSPAGTPDVQPADISGDQS